MGKYTRKYHKIYRDFPFQGLQKYTKIFHTNVFKNIPKYSMPRSSKIYQIYHLATLLVSGLEWLQRKMFDIK
jgi:TM2 domain-containing membrane protein YozV